MHYTYNTGEIWFYYSFPDSISSLPGHLNIGELSWGQPLADYAADFRSGFPQILHIRRLVIVKITTMRGSWEDNIMSCRVPFCKKRFLRLSAFARTFNDDSGRGSIQILKHRQRMPRIDITVREDNVLQIRQSSAVHYVSSSDARIQQLLVVAGIGISGISMYR